MASTRALVLNPPKVLIQQVWAEIKTFKQMSQVFSARRGLPLRGSALIFLIFTPMVFRNC